MVPTVAVVHKKEPVDRPVLPFHYVAPVFHKRETHEEPVVQQDVAPVVQVRTIGRFIPIQISTIVSIKHGHSSTCVPDDWFGIIERVHGLQDLVFFRFFFTINHGFDGWRRWWFRWPRRR